MCNVTCSKRVSKIVFRVLTSNFGLLIAVLIYSVMGAAIFQRLERDQTEKQKDIVKVIREKCLRDLWDFTESLNVLYKENWTSVVEQSLKRFEEDVVLATRKFKYDGPNAKGRSVGFTESLLYAVTIITTVGNGNLTPSSEAGKIITIVYSLLGIPITLVFLTRNGILLADGVRLIFRKLCHCAICHENQQMESRTETTLQMKKITQLENDSNHLNSSSFNVQALEIRALKDTCEDGENRLMDRSVTLEVNSFLGGCQENHQESPEEATPMEERLKTSQSFGPLPDNDIADREFDMKMVSARNGKQDSSMALLSPTSLSGSQQLALNSRQFQFYVRQTPDVLERPMTDLPRRKTFIPVSSPLDPTSTQVLLRTKDLSDLSNKLNECASFSEILTQKDLGFPGNSPFGFPGNSTGLGTKLNNELVPEESRSSKKSGITRKQFHDIPVAFVLFLLVSYITLGGAIFSSYEGWTFPEGAYFSFMALLTIGYTEPNFIGKSGRGKESHLVMSFYLVCGLIIVAMCLNLIQDRARK